MIQRAKGISDRTGVENASRLRQAQENLRSESDFTIGNRSLFGSAHDRYGAHAAAVVGMAHPNREILREFYRGLPNMRVGIRRASKNSRTPGSSSILTISQFTQTSDGPLFDGLLIAIWQALRIKYAPVSAAPKLDIHFRHKIKR